MITMLRELVNAHDIVLISSFTEEIENKLKIFNGSSKYRGLNLSIPKTKTPLNDEIFKKDRKKCAVLLNAFLDEYLAFIKVSLKLLSIFSSLENSWNKQF